MRPGQLSLLYSDGTHEDMTRDRVAQLYSRLFNQRTVQDVLAECDSQGAVWFDEPVVTGFQKTLGGVRLWLSGEDNCARHIAVRAHGA